MFLDLKHKHLDVYKEVSFLVKEVYTVSILLPEEEKFNMVSQVRRAALSVKLNLAEGCSRKSETERKRFFEIARGSIIEIDAAFEVAVDLNYVKHHSIERLGILANKCFAMLTNMIKMKGEP